MKQVSPLCLSILAVLLSLFVCPLSASEIYSDNELGIIVDNDVALLLGDPSAVDMAGVSFVLSDKENAAVKSEKDTLKEDVKKARKHKKYEARQARKQAKQVKRNEKTIAKAEKNAKKLEEKMAKLEPKTVYIYGAGMNFQDSVVYVTDSQKLDSIFIEVDGQLRDHYAYTAALKFYLESHYLLSNETCAVFYGDNAKKAAKRYDQMIKKLQKKNFIVNIVPKSEFAFLPEDDGVDDFTKAIQTGQQAENHNTVSVNKHGGS